MLSGCLPSSRFFTLLVNLEQAFYTTLMLSPYEPEPIEIIVHKGAPKAVKFRKCGRPAKRPRDRPIIDLQKQPVNRPHPVGGLNLAKGSPLGRMDDALLCSAGRFKSFFR